MAPVIRVDLQGLLPLVATGKVREIYELSEATLLFVATDRISAYDVVMETGIDQKGAILAQLSEFWFTLLQSMIPTLRTHFLSSGIPDRLQHKLPSLMSSQLQKRSMVVQKLTVLPIESIVRGYITGSAWVSYEKSGTVCGIPLPAGLQQSEKLQHPLWTPSTKADAGGKDENISPAKAAKLVGKQYANQIETLSLDIYHKASLFAAVRGIIIADTKFEFGLDESTTPPSMVLLDEVLTPDSSRFWSADSYAVGRGQSSFDKQYLRDWLVHNGLDRKEGVEVPEDIAKSTMERYKQAYHKLVGRQWDEASQ